jgi:hypothetical protein
MFATIIAAASIALPVVAMLAAIQTILITMTATPHVALIATPAMPVRHAAKLAMMKRVITAPPGLITATNAHTIFMGQLTIHNINKNYL